MSFEMYMGFISGLLAGLLAVAVVLRAKKQKSAVVEDDERTQLITGRAASATLLGLAIFAFVAWVAENVIRHLDGLDPQFVSPWSIMLCAGFLLYLVLWYMESRKVSDMDAEPSEREKRKLQVALVGMGVSVTSLAALFASTGDRMDRSVLIFLGGFEFLLLIGIGFVFGKMYLRKRA